jgi:hypothetical protein
MGLDPNLEVPAVITPLTAEQLRSALDIGHHAIRGGEAPPRQRLRFAWCQVCVETGGGASSWVWNVGNIKTREGDSWRGGWYRLPLPPGSPEWPYQRAYLTDVSGCSDYWKLIFGRYREAIDVVDRGGSLDDAAATLRRLGYFEADAGIYARAMNQWAAKYDRLWPPPKDASSAATIIGAALLVGSIAAAAAFWMEAS